MAKNEKAPRQMPIISVRPRISKKGKDAAEKILFYRLLAGEGVADVTINQLVDEALEVHAECLTQKYGPMPVQKLKAMA